MPVTISFDKAAYNIGEVVTISLGGLTAGVTYTVKLVNTGTGAVKVLFSFIATTSSATFKTYVQAYWFEYNRFAVDGDSVPLPTIINQLAPALLRLTTDQIRYKRGEAVTINIDNLITGVPYSLRVEADSGEVLIEDFTPTTSTYTKLYSIPNEFSLGIHNINLYQKFNPGELLIASTPIEIYEPAAAPPPTPLQPIIDWLSKNWWILLVVVILLLLLW